MGQISGAPADSSSGPSDFSGGPADSSGGPTDSSGGPADFPGGPADFPGGPADSSGGPADFPSGPAALNSLENSTQTRPHTPAPHTLEITKNVWDVRHVWVLFRFRAEPFVPLRLCAINNISCAIDKRLCVRELQPTTQIRIPPAHPKRLHELEILRTFAARIMQLHPRSMGIARNSQEQHTIHTQA